MRTAYLGTTDFAATVLRRLAASPHRPVVVVTRPDRPRGRGRRLASPPVAETARELGIAVEQPEDVNAPEARSRLGEAAPEVVCVCAFGALIRDELLAAHDMLNVHPSLLPRWRGAAPVERALMAGDAETGVSIMQVTAGLDSGPVCAQRAEPIRADDDYGSLAARLAALGGDLLVEVLDERPECVEQDEAGVTYAEKLGPEDRLLDPTRPAVELERVVRALTPHVGARVELPGAAEPVGVRYARAFESVPEAVGEPGSVVATEGRLVLVCAEGALELVQVQPPGGRPMPAADYLRGHPPS